ncbi:hypothetical protein [Enterococcus faecalis]|uniref:hypothetical protein n=1 Tax=Enterococcus faecalis TaxID=1351 RepID=UPI000CF34F49|nr:hypothetical protein [Enterococcus faecalis]MDN3097380.1 hypothetical protein [Enterococcus faecalis]PQG36083.1 hypothetical protein CUS34_13215 [Enterococcus faecalis]RXV19249.1 hypothetical protein CYQ38_11065 [Enterococcus faecalis]RXV20202.1 hypothetical protein CYQ36_12725 [Enterococcus faecalis]HAP4713829.1 hypothetical protein [Enterococcus faecalis]
MKNKSINYEAVLALVVKFFLGMFLYWIMNGFRHVSNFFPYNDVVTKVNQQGFYKFIYFVMNFTEGEFYGGLFTTLFLLIGGLIAWQLYRKNSKWQGFAIAGGSGAWPWVLASQLLSLFLTIYVFDFTRFFTKEVLWLPTFIVVVGTPPALTLVYGPGWKKLGTISLLSALFTFPFANWLNAQLMPLLNVPGTVSNVTTMAFVGWIVSAICHQLPWMVPSVAPIAQKRQKQPKIENTQTFQWSIRRTFADFSEAWFYGNELVGGLVILGVLTDWFVNINHITNGSGLVPDILMGQMIASAVGVFLYRKHFAEEGWYPTFMPLVSIVPGVILMMGGGFWLSLTIAVLAGISAAPVGSYIAKRLPPFVPGAVGFVSGMAVLTILLSAVLHTFDIFV